MKTNILINTDKNNLNIFDCDEIGQFFANNQPENFIEDSKLLFNIQNQDINTNMNNSLDLPNKNKSHGSSIKTNATIGEISQKGNEDFSFFSFNNEQTNNFNIIQKKKELTKESIEILNNFISKEKLIISNINNINETQNSYAGNTSIKDIKNNLFAIDNKLSIYFKKPYMRRNIKKKKDIIKNYYEGVQEEDEKIKFDDIKMEDLKDDDSKTNNDSIDEMNTVLEKKNHNKYHKY